MATDSAEVENEVEMGENDYDANNEGPGTRSQSTESSPEVIYTPSTPLAKRGDLNGASIAHGSEYGVEDETLDLLTEATNMAEANMTKQKTPKQALPNNSLDRAAMSKLWTMRMIQDLTLLNQDLTNENIGRRAKVAALEKESKRNNTAGGARQKEDTTITIPPRGPAAWTKT